MPQLQEIRQDQDQGGKERQYELLYLLLLLPTLLYSR